jgi:alpha-L-rhamnosidase
VSQVIPNKLAEGVPSYSLQAQPPPRPASPNKVFLPLVTLPSGFSQNQPIWVHANSPASQEVALFRHNFTLDGPLAGSELSIFADTRYEVWLDGAWIGRGPARFSRLTHEYDVYPLSDLAPGAHLLAVLVQWAPNYRRSDSTTPCLQASIQGKENEKTIVVERTGPEWKGVLSNAWRQDAALVHAWGLIGPTELLDLARLPADWMRSSFSDQEWPAAVVKTVSDQDMLANINYQPRSIAPLEWTSRPILVHDAGLISPERLIGELVPPLSDPYPLPFSAQVSTPFTIEIVSPLGPPATGSVRLDGKTLTWISAKGPRPGVYSAVKTLTAGNHQLLFSDIPAEGLTFAVSTSKVHFSQIPFQQGINAGRRTLLADLSSQPDKVLISSGEELNTAFPSLPAYLVLDLGRVMQGRLTAQVSGPVGAIVDIGWDERLYQNIRPLPYPGPLHKEWNQVDSWVLDGTPRSISTLDTRAGRYILIAVWGNGPVRIDHIQVLEEHYPVQQAGSFVSSNLVLNRVWQVGADSAFINMNDAFSDTPWRERGQWWGDAYVVYHTNLAAFGDTALLRRGLGFMAEAFQQGRPDSMAPGGDSGHLLDYGMLWVQSLKDYWQLTGDLLPVKQDFPVLQQFLVYLATYKNPTTGLLDIPQGLGSTTTLIDWQGSTSRTGQSTAVNALYYKTLMDAAALARSIGEAASSSSWTEQAQSIKQSANRYLYLGGKHRYLSSIERNKPIDPSPHAQAWALACGLVPDEEAPAVASSLVEMLSRDPATPNVDIYGMYWVLEALGRAGRFSEGTNLVQSYYGQLLDLGATTWWETFKADQYYWSSLSHGWGSGPTWFLTRYILGAQRTGPLTWLVKPAFAGVQTAAGELPLRADPLRVSWAYPPCGNPSLELTGPPGARGQVVIPFTDQAITILLNGKPIWQNGIALIQGVTQASDGIHVDLQSGEFSFEVRGVQSSCRSSSPLVQAHH